MHWQDLHGLLCDMIHSDDVAGLWAAINSHGCRSMTAREWLTDIIGATLLFAFAVGLSFLAYGLGG